MRKKYITFMMAAVISAALLTACGGTGTNQNAMQGTDQTSESSGSQNGTDQESGNSSSSRKKTGQESGNSSGSQNGAGQAADSDSQNGAGQAAGSGSQSGTASAVTEDEARKTALSDAGVTEEQITGIRVKKDHDDGRQVYDVEFYSDNKEYDYEIDASTGEILSSDFEIENDFNKDSASDLNPAVSQEEASAAALAKVQGASEKDLRIKLDDDDGKMIYEGDIYYNGTEYEFEIDAATGDFLEWSEERN
ncbi:PepSY domain-containing protein [Blautia marasmi]|uniref:PepSY domain-containing protein n=1 Tax=Blautia marasmi TaxID=1917868 RepID=UPI001D08C204|nr:PepSY domain-containing protein [Blautia marasmi]MCB6194280.1 PepSY domain-containing protein [Blautia marasmi]